jgi:Domain of unknown function (DUF4442)
MTNIIAEAPASLKLNAEQVKRLKDFNSPSKIWLWLLVKLPAAWFMGIRIKSVTAEQAQVSLPYAWRSQNPYKSIYFAAQCAAAELSTGVLATTAIEGRGRVSMLVSDVEAKFMKKANTRTIFTCTQGQEVFDIVERAIKTGQPQSVQMISTGVQATGEVVSITKITWTFLAKSEK